MFLTLPSLFYVCPIVKKMEIQCGRLDFDDGGTYIGQWHRGFAHGLGLSTGPQGTGEYSGEWDSGYEKCGTYIWPNGNVYTGTWSKGKRHGSGQQVKGNCVYLGQMSNGACGPLGIKTTFNGQVLYRGDWKLNRFDGFGMQECSDGSIYSGAWSRGRKHGLGVRISFNSTTSDEDLGRTSQNSPKENNSGRASNNTGDVSFNVTNRYNPINTSDSPAAKERAKVRSNISLRRLRKQSTVLESTCSSPANVSEERGKRSSAPSSLFRRTTSVDGTDNNCHGMRASAYRCQQAIARKQAMCKWDDAIGKSTEVYAGEWVNDKRTGCGVLQRSDGYQYIGEWLHNQKHGLGMLRYPNDKHDMGKFEFDNFVHRVPHRVKMNILRQSKLQDLLNQAMRKAQEAASAAKAISLEYAQKQADLARQAAEEAQNTTLDAKKLSQKARELVSQMEPLFSQPGSEWQTKRGSDKSSTGRPLEIVSELLSITHTKPSFQDFLSQAVTIPDVVPMESRNVVLQIARAWRSKIGASAPGKPLSARKRKPGKKHHSATSDIYESFASMNNPKGTDANGAYFANQFEAISSTSPTSGGNKNDTWSIEKEESNYSDENLEESDEQSGMSPRFHKNPLESTTTYHSPSGSVLSGSIDQSTSALQTASKKYVVNSPLQQMKNLPQETAHFIRNGDNGAGTDHQDRRNLPADNKSMRNCTSKEEGDELRQNCSSHLAFHEDKHETTPKTVGRDQESGTLAHTLKQTDAQESGAVVAESKGRLVQTASVHHITASHRTHSMECRIVNRGKPRSNMAVQTPDRFLSAPQSPYEAEIGARMRFDLVRSMEPTGSQNKFAVRPPTPKNTWIHYQAESHSCESNKAGKFGGCNEITENGMARHINPRLTQNDGEASQHHSTAHDERIKWKMKAGCATKAPTSQLLFEDKRVRLHFHPSGTLALSDGELGSSPSEASVATICSAPTFDMQVTHHAHSNDPNQNRSNAVVARTHLENGYSHQEVQIKNWESGPEKRSGTHSRKGSAETKNFPRGFKCSMQHAVGSKHCSSKVL
ncbi:unnamed protein product [Dicrocoelium dendriticum]|nr:unnamed protein product [Dicrocoelium dendriticum]